MSGATIQSERVDCRAILARGSLLVHWVYAVESPQESSIYYKLGKLNSALSTFRRG